MPDEQLSRLITRIITFAKVSKLHIRKGPQSPPSPYIIYGPHGYRTFPHSRCQAVPTAEGVALADIAGDWSLVEYHTSFGGKPFPPHSPYLCPESRIVITPQGKKMNVSQVQYGFDPEK